MIARFTKDIFLQRYAVYFSGSMVVAFLNYLFHPVLSRVLSPEEFGDVQAFLALLAQSALLLGAFSIVAVNITANTDSDQERNAILFKLQAVALWVMGSVVALLIFTLPALASFFNFLSPYPLLALALILPITTLNTFRNAYLQGRGHFSKLALGGMIGAGGRVVAATLLALAGFGALGATLGIVVSSTLLLGYLIYHTRHTLFIDVKELQKRLRAEGFFTFPTDTGYFGPVTLAAVKAYQAAHPTIGFVTGFCGPLTRAELNK